MEGKESKTEAKKGTKKEEKKEKDEFTFVEDELVGRRVTMN
jgi:hypothetical protein